MLKACYWPVPCQLHLQIHCWPTKKDLWVADQHLGEYEWSAGIRIQPFVEQCNSQAGRVARQVPCHCIDSRFPPLRFNVGITKDADDLGTVSILLWTVLYIGFFLCFAQHNILQWALHSSSSPVKATLICFENLEMYAPFVASSSCGQCCFKTFRLVHSKEVHVFSDLKHQLWYASFLLSRFHTLLLHPNHLLTKLAYHV